MSTMYPTCNFVRNLKAEKTYGRGVHSEEPSVQTLRSVGFRQNKTLRNVVLAKPEKVSEDDTIVVNPSTHNVESQLSPLSVSHVLEANIKFEQNFPEELSEHYCNSCNYNIYDVREHIQTFHSNEMVILQNAESDDNSQDAGEDAADSNAYVGSSKLYAAKETVQDMVTKSCDNIQALDDEVYVEVDIKKVVHPQGSSRVDKRMPSTSMKCIPNLTLGKRSVHYQRPRIVNDHIPISKSQNSLHPSSFKVINTKHKALSQKVCNVGKMSSEVDDNNDTPHAQIVIDPDLLQNETMECDIGIGINESDKVKTTIPKIVKQLETEGNKSLSKAKKPLVKGDSAESIVSTPIIKVPPKLKKPTLVQAHIVQLLRSKGLDSLKQSIADSSPSEASNEDVLQKLFTAANEYLGESRPNNVLGDGQNPHCESTPKIKEEDRNIVLKFLTDPIGTGTIPIFQCDVCNLEFMTAHLFADHKCKIPKTVALTLCELCGLKCKSNRDLQLHLNTHDPSSMANKLFQRQVKKLLSVPATCDVCKTEFTSERGLKIHQRMHRPDNIKKVAEMNNKVEYQCDICNTIVYSQRTLRIHNKIHFSTQTDERPRQQQQLGSQPSNRKVGVLSCKMCKESFSSNADLKTHWQDHCSVRVKPLSASEEESTGQGSAGTELFTCNICGEQLAESLRMEHQQTHPGDMPFVCKDCNHPFVSEMDLYFHMSVHNTDVELACLTCRTKFTDATLLKLHMKTHAGADQPYPCGFCGKYFSKPHEKVKHERVHTGEKPYECKTCGMRFRVSYLLNVHTRIHSGIRPYTCKQCSKTFRSSSNYFRHIRIHSNVRAYACPYCPKKFKTGVQLAGHKKCHTKPYSCPQCGRRFAAVYELRTHVTTHNKHNHNCHICGAAYARAYALIDHMKTHGENIPLSPEEEEEEDAGMEVANDSY